MCVRKTREDFINKAKAMHGEKYSYDEVDYKNNKTKVGIICPIHGKFLIEPVKHTSAKRGCPKCSRESQFAKMRITPAEALKRFKEVHEERYVYDDIDTSDGVSTTQKIKCSVHGYFYQSIQAHMVGKGCPKCGRTSAAYKKRKGVGWFIQESRKVHGDKYDYSCTDYVSSDYDVKIYCPDHGYFYQNSYAHRKGHGCRECAYRDAKYVGGFGDKTKQLMEDAELGNTKCNLYVVRLIFPKIEYVKVGITTKPIDKRFQTIKNKSDAISFSGALVLENTLSNCYRIEQAVLEHFQESRCNPEVRFSGWTECLENIAEQEVIDYIEELV